MSFVKSSSPNAAPQTLSEALKIEKEFITPDAVSIHGRSFIEPISKPAFLSAESIKAMISAISPISSTFPTDTPNTPGTAIALRSSFSKPVSRELRRGITGRPVEESNSIWARTVSLASSLSPTATESSKSGTKTAGSHKEAFCSILG